MENLTLDKVYQASYILKSLIRNTPLIKTNCFSIDNTVYLKPESLQVTGSFKVRGAAYKLASLTDEEKKKGVIACSAGNHAQGVALSAKKLGINATIFIPEGAPISKVEATKNLGADVVLVKGCYDDAYEAALKAKNEKGATFIHPFDDPFVIAGQATIGVEILEELDDLDAIIVPVGGGGLAAGVSFAVKSLNPKIKVYGVQAAGASSMVESINSRSIKTLDRVSTIADGIAVKTPGNLTFDLCSKYLDGICTVSDDEISMAILTLMEEQKMIAEGAGAVSVASIMYDKFNLHNQKVCSIVSGGNIDVNILSRVISRGLLMAGRNADITIELMDKPGELEQVAKMIASTGANVVGVRHDRGGENTDVNACILRVKVETRNKEHVDEIKTVLSNSGYKIISN